MEGWDPLDMPQGVKSSGEPEHTHPQDRVSSQPLLQATGHCDPTKFLGCWGAGH